MNERYQRVLEYPKILNRLAGLAVSAMGKERALALRPSGDFDEVRRLQAQTEEASSVIAYTGGNPMSEFDDVREYLKLSTVGATLSMKALLSVAGALRACRTVRKALVTEREDTPILTEMGSRIASNRMLEEDITNAIISEDEMSDHASPELYDIRRHIRVINDRVRDKLNSYIRSASTQKYLMDSIITMRNGRYVIPVKAEYRQQVPGLVHDQSGSGSTLFIEPMAIVEAGNELKEWTLKERQEMEKILKDFSARIAPDAPMIASSLGILADLDCVFARAYLAREMNAVEPKLNADGRVNLIRARHPLIDPKKCVPVDIALGREYDSLIITGPNTGGKTVTLKTAGLLCAMAQCGFLIPADERSEICVFDEFLVDIGDEQSIEQSLSTFSGHMKKITGILELAMPHTLVLLDELGAGTDPAEGAALAVAIIEELRRRGVLLMATTHYAELKVFALETKGVVNASCEFDLETLRPTYKLSVGVPGKSNAFLISEKLGIPERVIEAAQQHLSAEDKRLDAVLGQLDDLKLQLKESQNEVEELKNEASHQLEAAQKKRDELIQQGENELEAARAKARALAQQVESQAYALTDELRQLQKDERMSTQQKAQRAREIAKKESEKLFIGTEVVHNPVKEFVPLKEVKVGQEVCIAELNQLATVLALPDKNGDVLVRAGIIKTKIPLKGLKQPEKLVKEKKPQTKAQQRYSRLTGDANRPNGRVERVQRSAKMECNLLGLTVDEALPEVDSFIDRAILNGQTVVYLIHGNGTGALRTAIHKHLRGNRMVKSFRLGRYGEGESGVTVVELK